MSKTAKTVIYLKCESDKPSYDQSLHEVEVINETEEFWNARPTYSPDCPVMRWPKMAWARYFTCGCSFKNRDLCQHGNAPLA